MKRLGLLSFVMALALPSQANDFFGDVGTTTSAPVRASGPVQWLGWAQHKTAYGYRAPEAGFSRDEAALSRFESTLYGRVTGRWGDVSVRAAGSLAHDWLPDAADAGIWSAYEFTSAQADARRWQGFWDDSYVRWQPGDFWLTAGYQTFAWGEAESLAVTDVLAPRDQRWPGQADIESVRLPVPALNIRWRNAVELVVLDATATDRLAGPFDEFDALAELRATGAGIATQTPRQRLGMAARWQQRWAGLDVQLMAASLNAYTPTLRSVAFGGSGVEQVTLRPEALTVIGSGVQWTRGSWLWRTEQAWHQGVRLPTEQALAPWVAADEWRSMVGAEYNGWSNLTVSAEMGTVHITQSDQAVAADAWRWSQSLRVRWSGWNERLSLTAQAVNLPGNEGTVGRLEAEWKPNDPLTLSLSVVDYMAWDEEQMLYPARYNDTVTLNLRFGF